MISAATKKVGSKELRSSPPYCCRWEAEAQLLTGSPRLQEKEGEASRVLSTHLLYLLVLSGVVTQQPTKSETHGVGGGLCAETGVQPGLLQIASFSVIAVLWIWKFRSSTRLQWHQGGEEVEYLLALTCNILFYVIDARWGEGLLPR